MDFCNISLFQDIQDIHGYFKILKDIPKNSTDIQEMIEVLLPSTATFKQQNKC
jgi:hypothetical protein